MAVCSFNEPLEDRARRSVIRLQFDTPPVFEMLGEGGDHRISVRGRLANS